jgi:hypothetical protein
MKIKGLMETILTNRAEKETTNNKWKIIVRVIITPNRTVVTSSTLMTLNNNIHLPLLQLIELSNHRIRSIIYHKKIICQHRVQLKKIKSVSKNTQSTLARLAAKAKIKNKTCIP